MTNPQSKLTRGRPRIMKNTRRIMVQLEDADYTILQDTLPISVSEFFRLAVSQYMASLKQVS